MALATMGGTLAMRTLLPLLVLGTLLILAGEWQSRNRTAPLAPDEARASDAGTADGDWDLLVLGRPSGAEPLRRREAPPPPGLDGDARERPQPPAQPVPSDTRYVVRPNDALGLICQTHYDVRPLSSVIKAVAEYNDLDSVDSIQSGDVLLLPDPAVLFQDR